MKTVKMINNKVLILFLIAILIALSMPMSVFADDEGDQPKDERYIYSLKDFWENYDPEDIGYHVVDPMEKIYLMESEEPLEIQVVREEDDGLLLEHFLGLTLTWVYSDTDPTIINYVEAATPDYEVTEEEGVLTFIFSKDSLKSMENDQRYEFLFTFDDGQAYSLVWASDGSLNLVYTESGHVFLEPPEIVDPYPLPAAGPVQNDEQKVNTEPVQMDEPIMDNEPALVNESAIDNESVQLVTDENTVNNSNNNNVPKTGDPTDMIWVLVMAAAVSGLAGVLSFGRKKN